MSGAAISLRQFLGGAESLLLTPGTDGLELLIPGQETISAGVCPIVPSLITAVEVREPTAQTRVRSGQLKTSRVFTKRRGGLSIRWTLDSTELDTLREFFRDQVGQHLRPFFVAPDVDANLVAVRPLAPPQESWDSKPGHTITASCEEMFA
ncbi:MAG: hypothetical protein AAFV77_01385 [Planctomycetota bacterium]